MSTAEIKVFQNTSLFLETLWSEMDQLFFGVDIL